ncbi:MAG: orotate phosphoribosyltransferase [Alphaproteobacteria bacterium]|nr:orotate phosphoribosyltransferase [Alphaproteobacteria bacterium]
MTTLDPSAVAAALLDIQAVHIRPEQPFTFTSGRISPVYVDCRKIIAFPATRSLILDQMTHLIRQQIGADQIDAVAGGETAGIPYAAWIADRLDKPMLYVRKKPKGFGRNAQIEGAFDPGARVLLVEDLATDGGSKRVFVQALRDAEAVVTDTLVVFFYQAAGASGGPLEDIGVRLWSLATWADILRVAEDSGRKSSAELAEVRAFLGNPAAWSKAHGGPEI